MQHLNPKFIWSAIGPDGKQYTTWGDDQQAAQSAFEAHWPNYRCVATMYAADEKPAPCHIGPRRAALRESRATCPTIVRELPFVAVNHSIVRGNDNFGLMRSHKFAVRTANALNAYKPNAEGV